MQWDDNSIVIILCALFAASEVLAQIPSVKANSVFQLFYEVLKIFTGKKK